MRVRKKLCIALCIAVSVTTVLLGCGKVKTVTNNKTKIEFSEDGLPIVKDKINLKFVAPKIPTAPNFNEMEIFKRLEKDTNVHIEWDNIPDTQYGELKSLLLASGDLPDAFYNASFSDNDIITYGENGTLIPLEELIDKYAPNLKKIFEERPELKTMITAPNGHIYTLPGAEEMGLIQIPFFTSINKKWLDKLGLPIPKTLEEFHETLIAFRDKDPNGNGKKDEIPFSFVFRGWCSDIGDMFGPFGITDNPEHRIVKDGKVIFTAVQPEYKKALQTFYQWYKEGLIDKEAFINKEAQYLAKGKVKDEVLGTYIWWETEEVVGPDRAKDYVLLPPLKGKNGQQMVGHSNGQEYSRAVFAITKANKNPEITMRWVDQLYDPKMSAQINWGSIDDIYKEDDNGMLVNMTLPEGISMAEFRLKVAPRGVFIVLKDYFGKVVDMEARAKQRLNDINNIYGPYESKEFYPMIFFKPEDLEKINTIEVSLQDYVNQMRAKWIVEGGIENDWDDYVAKVKQMGLDDLMKIYQDNLDNFNKKK